MNIHVERAKEPGARRQQYIIDGFLANFLTMFRGSAGLMLADTEFGWLVRFFGIDGDREVYARSIVRGCLFLQKPEASFDEIVKKVDSDEGIPESLVRFPKLRLHAMVVKDSGNILDDILSPLYTHALGSRLARMSPRIAELPMLGIGDFVTLLLTDPDQRPTIQVLYGSRPVFIDAVLDEFEEYVEEEKELLAKAEEEETLQQSEGPNKEN